MYSAKTYPLHYFRIAATAVALAGAAAVGSAQQIASSSLPQEAMLSEVPVIAATPVSSALPDAPSSVLMPGESSSSTSAGVPNFGVGYQEPGTVAKGQIVPPGKQIAPAHAITIPAGWQAARLTPRGKFAASLVESYSWQSIAGYVVAGGYSQVTDGQPNYGADPGRGLPPNNESDGETFGKRVGAAALRGTTENILADGLLASAFHEDPRYYIEGDSYGFFHRLFYSVTRPLVTQSDSGRVTEKNRRWKNP
jgi:hypothetical protein